MRNDDLDRAQAPGIHRNVALNEHAEYVKHGGACYWFRRIEVIRTLFRGASEIDRCFAFITVDCDANFDLATLIHFVGEMAVWQLVENAAHTFSRIVLNMAHIGFDDFFTEETDDLFKFSHAFFISGNLRFQIIDVLREIAHRVGRACQKCRQSIFAESAAINELEVVYIDTFLLDIDRQRRH
ncbi:hypothetical protein D3C80_931570 [compost metagenome]